MCAAVVGCSWWVLTFSFLYLNLCLVCYTKSFHVHNIIHAGGEMGSVVVMDWRGTNPVLLKYQPHSRDVTRLAFAPWK